MTDYGGSIAKIHFAVALICSISAITIGNGGTSIAIVEAFAPNKKPINTAAISSSSSIMRAKPQRFSDNADGVVYINDKCINCSACSNFAPKVFRRSDHGGDTHHIVYNQPSLLSETDIDDTRAALAACPVAAIRVETLAERRHRGSTPDEKQKIEQSWSDEDEALVKQMSINPKFNGLSKPFPRPLLTEDDGVYYLGHHNEHSFGAMPYLVTAKHNNNQNVWIMIDTPKFSKSSIQAIESLTGSDSGPDYLLLTHVDDTADHGKWSQQYPNMKRIFHSGDLGKYNWLHDTTLEDVEILLQQQEDVDEDDRLLQAFDLDGKPIVNSMEEDDNNDVVVLHTPGHSPGSITLWKKANHAKSTRGVLFTGDTYAYTTRDGGCMNGFPRYGNDLKTQAKTLKKLLTYDWDIIAPGHGHPRFYNDEEQEPQLLRSIKEQEMEQAIGNLLEYGGWRSKKWD